MSTLNIESREKLSQGELNNARKEGKVPAVIYGTKSKDGSVKSQNIFLNEKEVVSAHKKGGFFSNVVTLNHNGKEIIVLPQEIQFDVVKGNPLHADFLEVSKDSVVKVSIPVKFKNKEKSPGIKRGGVLNVVRRAIAVYCKVNEIPDALYADIGNKRIKQNIKFSELQTPASVRPVISDRDFTIATIAGRVTDEDRKAAEDEAA